MHTMSFIYVWGLVIASLCYSFLVAKLVRKGIMRQILIFPVLLIFFTVPLFLSSLHLVGITSFFIAWLASFKIILFALGRGPLYSNPVPLSLPVFLAVSCLPIKIHLSPKPTTSHPHGGLGYSITFAFLILSTKVLMNYSSSLPDKALFTLYAIQIYFGLDIIIQTAASAVRATSSLELEPHFNKPHLATSLQNFWGRRWNLIVTGILRPTVYEPTIQLFSFLGQKKSRYPAVFITFVVSGLMHELIFFYIGRLRPDWKVMWFFLIHGFCTAVEIAIKKTVGGRWRIPSTISQVLTIGFMITTSVWLFFPAFKRCNMFEKAFEEYASIGAFAARTKKTIMASHFSVSH